MTSSSYAARERELPGQIPYGYTEGASGIIRPISEDNVSNDGALVSAANDWKSGLTSFEQHWLENVEGRGAVLGIHKYDNGGMEKVGNYVAENPNYYLYDHDVALIKHFAKASAKTVAADIVKKVSASLLDKSQKVTLVSRGPGTAFDVKERALIEAFQDAGIEVAKVVYIDVSEHALTKSVAEGKALLPNAEHISIQGDIFARHDFEVVGLEVNTCFGGTITNTENTPGASPPMTSVIGKLDDLYNVTSAGAHLITSIDHIDNPRTAKKAYEDAGHIFKDVFLRHHLQWTAAQIDRVDYMVEFHEASSTVIQGFDFRDQIDYQIGGRGFFVSKHAQMWFENSLKLDSGLMEQANQSAGWSYSGDDAGSGVMRLPENNMGYHHTLKI